MAVGAAGAAGTRCGWAWKAFRGGEGALGIARLYIWVMRLERVYRGGCRHSRIMINVAVNFNMASVRRRHELLLISCRRNRSRHSSLFKDFSTNVGRISDRELSRHPREAWSLADVG